MECGHAHQSDKEGWKGIMLKPLLRARRAWLAREWKRQVGLSLFRDRKEARIGVGYIKGFPRRKVQGFVVDLSPAIGEAPICISIRKNMRTIGRLKINFAETGGKKVLIMEGPQGAVNAEGNISRFEEAVKEHWTTYLAKRAIEHAKELGFSRAWLARPEASPSFVYAKARGKEREMLGLYYSLAKELGFKKVNPRIMELGL